MTFDLKQLDHFPAQPGVYLMKNAAGTVIYVGKANVLKNRIKQYFSGGDGRAMIPFLVEQTTHIDTIIVPSEKEALLLENTLIKKHQPKFNAILKDDKTFISLMINTTHEWPMLRLVRNKGTPKENGLYFGPYTNAFAARQTYELLTTLFPLRQCSDEELKRRKRPCLLYSIKKCCAPCVNKCTREEYDSYVKETVRFLKGQDKEILKDLNAEMKLAAENLEYEKAASLLRTIRQLEHVLDSNQIVAKISGKDTDALALFRQGEEVMLVQLLFRNGKLTGSEHICFSKVLEDDQELYCSFILQHYTQPQNIPQEILLPLPLTQASFLEEILSEAAQHNVRILSPQKGDKRALVELSLENAKVIFHQEHHPHELSEKMLLDLQETLKLTRYPKRIECFDTSNLSGIEPVASMVAFTEGDVDRKRHRLFKIKTTAKGDDYGAMREVLTRRLTRAKEENDLPDLIIVDGGKGQLNIAINVLETLNIASCDLIALAKQDARHDKGMTEEKIFLPGHNDPIHLNPRSSLLFLLQKIRDEAHRKAISFHRKRREKKNFTSKLDEIPGIGPAKRKRLLTHFGSVKKIFEASPDELASVKGITSKDIAAIQNYQA